jgi:hypothetical protein
MARRHLVVHNLVASEPVGVYYCRKGYLSGNLSLKGVLVSPEHQRRSDRVNLELAIQLSGVNAAGGSFTEQGRTVVVSQHGAKVACDCVLLPQQAITLRCHRTGMETLARVVGQIRHVAEQTYYGMEFADPGVNIWDIDFPPLPEAEPAAGRVLLECLGCHNLEVAHLDVFALEVLAANRCLMRPCARCTDRRVSVWKQPSHQEEGIPAATPRVRPAPRMDQQGRARINLKVEVCISQAPLGDELALTDDVSCGSFRFQSQRCYDVGSLINAALPYSPGAANVFAPARIMSVETLPGKGTFLYNAVYTSAETKGSPNSPAMRNRAA